MASNATIRELEFALKSENHFLVLPEEASFVHQATAMYLVSGFLGPRDRGLVSAIQPVKEEKPKKNMKIITSINGRRKCPLNWREDLFVTYESAEGIKCEEGAILWLWGANRPKELKMDRKSAMTRKPVVRHLASRVRRFIQISTSAQKSLIVKPDETFRGSYEIYLESRPGELVELVYELRRCLPFPPEQKFLRDALKNLFEINETANSDPLLHTFFERINDECNNL